MFLQDLWERRRRGRLDYKESSNLVASLPGVNWQPELHTRSLSPLLPVVDYGCPGCHSHFVLVIPTSMPVKKDVPYVCSYENDLLVA